MSHCLCCWTFVLQLNNKLSNKAIVLTPLTPLTPAKISLNSLLIYLAREYSNNYK